MIGLRVPKLAKPDRLPHRVPDRLPNRVPDENSPLVVVARVPDRFSMRFLSHWFPSRLTTKPCYRAPKGRMSWKFFETSVLFGFFFAKDLRSWHDDA